MERPLDTWTTEELVTAMTATSERIPELMKQAEPAIVLVVDRMVDTIEKGGHVFVVGAGTSGRLAVLDASEIRPTFGNRDIVVAVMAGGDDAVAAVDAEAGITEHNWDEALVKRAMIRSATEVIAIADASKFGHIAFAQAAPLSAVHQFVTDKAPTGALAEAFAKYKIVVRVVGEEDTSTAENDPDET